VQCPLILIRQECLSKGVAGNLYPEINQPGVLLHSTLQSGLLLWVQLGLLWDRAALVKNLASEAEDGWAKDQEGVLPAPSPPPLLHKHPAFLWVSTPLDAQAMSVCFFSGDTGV
jgi:hypothetical protein